MVASSFIIIYTSDVNFDIINNNYYTGQGNHSQKKTPLNKYLICYKYQEQHILRIRRHNPSFLSVDGINQIGKYGSRSLLLYLYRKATMTKKIIDSVATRANTTNVDIALSIHSCPGGRSIHGECVIFL